MTNSVDRIITQIKKEDIDIENQCFAPEEFKNGSKLIRLSMNCSSEKIQDNNCRDITVSEASVLLDCLSKPSDLLTNQLTDFMSEDCSLVRTTKAMEHEPYEVCPTGSPVTTAGIATFNDSIYIL
ncbi:unnamed protein product [Litomosoides sigmodontis]|uniref:Uncharacterized protein n=1 Tax=Litomosoides sigmodontis TaxID=42156 RepID=A0A3P6S6A5_LITSI|nr:unnamed protein product [Litomosoides sigmodontis]